MSNYPQRLLDHLYEQDIEGSEVFTTYTEDGTMFIIKHKGLGKWLTVIEWFNGSDDFQLINVCGQGFKRLHSVIHECKADE